MDLRKIKKLIELVEESGISELEVSDGDEAIRIARHNPRSPPVANDLPAGSPVVSRASSARAQTIRAPMAGTFYAAGEPGDEPFVLIGTRVETGAVVCIIESMKMMNEITATASGICSAVAVANGEPVTSGQVLFHID